MSTRSRIGIILKKEDLNKTFNCPDTPEGKEYAVKTYGRLMSVYCHNDGYIDGVGLDLSEMFPENDPGTYDKLLKYITKGDRTTSTVSYIEWRNEPWNYVQPAVCKVTTDGTDATADQFSVDEITEACKNIATSGIEYVYVYNASSMTWYMYDVYGNTFDLLMDKLAEINIR